MSAVLLADSDWGHMHGGWDDPFLGRLWSLASSGWCASWPTTPKIRPAGRWVCRR